MSKKSTLFIFLGPFLILFLLFRIAPILYAFILSLHNWQGIGPWEFAGLDNFKDVLTDPVALTAIKNTFFMALGTLVISIPISLILALIINSPNLPLKNMFRAMYFVPRVIALAVSGIIFLTLFDTNYGVVNYLLKSIGLINEGINWWGDPLLAKITIVFIRSWMSIPFMMIYFLTGLQNIPIELYDAAEVDGAKTIDKFFYITLPLLKPIALFVMVTGTVMAFQIFTIPYMITQGGPSNGTISIIQYMFSRGLNNFNFGLASAISTLLFLFLAALSYIELKVGSN